MGIIYSVVKLVKHHLDNIIALSAMHCNAQRFIANGWITQELEQMLVVGLVSSIVVFLSLTRS